MVLSRSAYKKYLFVLLIAILALLCNACAAKKKVVYRDDLVKAEAMIKAAEIAGAEEVAPTEMAQARDELARAGQFFDRDPRTGRLIKNIRLKDDYEKQVEQGYTQSLNNVEQALTRLREEGGKVKEVPPSPETLQAIRNNIKQEVVGEVRQLVEQEYSQKLETALKQAAPAAPKAPPLKLVSIRGDLYRAIKAEIGDDLEKWGMVIDRQYLSVGFVSPQTAFKSGSTWVNRKLRRTLEKFFPRFVQVLMRPEFKDKIKEIRVEGFASTNYKAADTAEERNHLNLLLSQERTANVLRFVTNLPKVKDNNWLAERLLPVGFDGKDPVVNKNGVEDEVLSRRVEFRVVLADEPQRFR